MVVEERRDVAANKHGVNHEERVERFDHQDEALKSPRPWRSDTRQPDGKNIQIELRHATEKEWSRK